MFVVEHITNKNYNFIMESETKSINFTTLVSIDTGIDLVSIYRVLDIGSHHSLE